jgi:glycosyltransferase involved in cell wall biosynthesis
MSSPTATEPVSVSAVMCTRNRAASIAQAVRTVLANDYPNFDMIVVDQSTDDSTGEQLRPIAEEDPRLTYLHVDEAGLSRAYNTGIRNTTGEVLVFTDDDCVAPPDWISTIVAAFESEPDGDLLYGTVVPFESGEGFGLTPLLDIDAPTRMSKKDGHFKVFGMGANFAARRRMFDTIGYFDEVLGGGGPLKSSQDFDLVYRVYHGGAVTLLRPEVVMRHDGRREREDWPALLTAYGHGDGGFYTKHIRCRDPYALWLLTSKVAVLSAKVGIKTVIHRSVPPDSNYIRGVWRGVRGSFGWNIDRKKRIYTTPKKAAKVAA